MAARPRNGIKIIKKLLDFRMKIGILPFTVASIAAYYSRCTACNVGGVGFGRLSELTIHQLQNIIYG